MVSENEGVEPILHVRVADSGIGIPPELQDAIFQAFVQAHDTITRRFGGTCLGLAVCRRTAAFLGGTLTVESTLDVGSTFHLKVPVEPAPLPDVAADGPTPAASEQPALSILLVDDDEVNRQVGMWLLSSLGHHTTVAEDGAAAVEAARSTPFDLVLMDVRMPIMDGFETTRRIRALPTPVWPLPRIVAMTADMTADTAQRCRDAGIGTVIAKPLHLQALRHSLTRQGVPAVMSVAGASPAACLDLSYLFVQLETLGMSELVRLGKLFSRVSRRILAALDAAVAMGDREEIGALAHRLRSAAGPLGLTELSATAAAVEAEVRRGADVDCARIAVLRRLRRTSLDALIAAARGGVSPMSP